MRVDMKNDHTLVMNVIAHSYIPKIYDGTKLLTPVQNSINVDYAQNHSVEKITYGGIFIMSMA